MPRYMVIHLRAKNDTNGNPRRFFSVIDLDSGLVVENIDEGYRGNGAWNRKYPDAIQGPVYETTPACRKEFLND